MDDAAPLLQDYLEDSAARLPDKVAISCGREQLTYAEIDRRANRLAHALAARGIRRGDRIVIFAENGPVTAVAFWAALKASAVPVLLGPQTRPRRLAYVLSDSGARALVSQAQLAPAFCEAAPAAGALSVAVIAGDLTNEPPLPMLPWDEAIGPANSAARPPRQSVDIDLAALVYTSGSTGEPKGVMLTHRNMLAASASIARYLAYRESDAVLCVLPFAFDYGLYQMLLAFKVGARLVLERSFAFPAAVLDTVSREGVTVFPGVPTLFAMLIELKANERWDLSRIRIVTNTAAALAPRQLRALRDLFSRARVFSMYGLTECKRCTYLPPEDLDRKPDSVGIAIPNTELWLVDDRGDRVPAGTVGELVIRGATVMRGYWNKPEATARKLRPGPIPGEQVLHTGDLCRMDEEGYLYFVARKDDVIKSRGEKVPPKEVEAALVEISGVKEAAVIGVPDEVLGQSVVAYVVLCEGARVAVKDLQRSCAARLEPWMVPQRIEVLPELPRSANGKVDKSALPR